MSTLKKYTKLTEIPHYGYVENDSTWLAILILEQMTGLTWGYTQGWGRPLALVCGNVTILASVHPWVVSARPIDEIYKDAARVCARAKIPFKPPKIIDPDTYAIMRELEDSPHNLGPPIDYYNIPVACTEWMYEEKKNTPMHTREWTLQELMS